MKTFKNKIKKDILKEYDLFKLEKVLYLFKTIWGDVLEIQFGDNLIRTRFYNPSKTAKYFKKRFDEDVDKNWDGLEYHTGKVDMINFHSFLSLYSSHT
jgi:hypothetical protein